MALRGMVRAIEIGMETQKTRTMLSKQALLDSIDLAKAQIASGLFTPEQVTIAKNGMISAAILLAKLHGASMGEAIDSVLGAGTYDRAIADMYAALRAKAGLAA